MAADLDIEKFIEGVRVRPPLWNKVDPMHRNLDFTNGLWSAIVDELGGNLSVAELKQKWHNLRDCFRREVRIAQAGKKKRRWIYYNQMLFLLTPEFMNKNVGKKKPQQVMVQNESLFPLKMEVPDEIIEFDLINTDSNNSEFIEKANFTCENTVKPTNEFAEENETCYSELGNDESRSHSFSKKNEQLSYSKLPTGSENFKTCPQKAGESSYHIHTATDNDDYHFAMSIIPHMRRVPVHRKLKMRIKISEIIAEESGYSETPS